MVKPLLTKNKNPTSKAFLNSPKDGFIQKKKNQKFKPTSVDKAELINGLKAQNNSSMKQQNLQKQKNASPQKSPRENKGQKKKEYQANDKKQQDPSKKVLNKNLTIDEEDDTDSEEDVNFKILKRDVLEDQSIVKDSDDNENEESDDDDSEEEEEEDDDDDDDDDEDEEEMALPNILGTSLADETDEDDEDYELKEEEVQANKGVKMFEGVKLNKSTDSNKDSSEVSGMEDSMTDDTDDEMEEAEDNEEVEDEEEEDNEDDEDEEEEDDEEEEQEDEDDDEESENEEEGNESALGLKALLGNSIADDDDDDEDFVAPGENDEDDDISDEEDEEEEGGEDEEEGNVFNNSDLNKSNKDSDDTSFEELKKDKTTIFVGNLPKDVKKKQLLKLFKPFGKIESVRLRGKISKSLNIPKKVAAIKNDLHPQLKSVYAYVNFVSEESVKGALSMNGTVFEGNHLRVSVADKSEDKRDPKKCVFLGNLHFNIDEDTIRKHFGQCGEIESVRVIRDKETRVGKGIGYVNFKTEDAVALALELDGTMISNREVRVKPNVDHSKNKKSKHRKRSRSTESTHSVLHKKSKTNAEATAMARNNENAKKRVNKKKQKDEKKQTSPQQESKFQGQKAHANKKRKGKKFDKKKQLLAEKLTAKPKKP